jgi:hypothetical protein
MGIQASAGTAKKDPMCPAGLRTEDLPVCVCVCVRVEIHRSGWT